ncbi:MAG: TonB-dependent receptor, partial [Verrucomicrobiota bacterium]
MKQNILRLSAPILLGAALSYGDLAAQTGETNPSEDIPSIEPYVVTPTKFPLSPEEAESAITILPASDLEARQVYNLEDALRLAPGVIFASSGQRGSNTSVFLRGTESDQTQFLIDGIRVSDSNILPNNFLGGASSHGLRAVEVLRGPQSALYGGSAIGGVISLWTPKGSGRPDGQFDVLAGSFGSALLRASSQGEQGKLAYSVSTEWEQTDNHRINNEFENFSYATRLDWSLAPSTTLGMTVRGAQRTYGSPGDINTNDPDNRDVEDFRLFTLFLDHQWNHRLSSRWTAGLLRQDLDFENPPFGTTRLENQKFVVDWQNTLSWADDQHHTVIGTNFEESSVFNSGFGSIDERERLFALYGQQSFRIGDHLSLTGGLRWEDYDTFGEAVTWRTTSAYELPFWGTVLRGSAGTGFRAPSFFELFATSTSFEGNPDLEPEESFGWDL